MWNINILFIELTKKQLVRVFHNIKILSNICFFIGKRRKYVNTKSKIWKYMCTQNVTAHVAFSLTRFLYINWPFVFMWYYNLNFRRVHLFIKGYQGTLTYRYRALKFYLLMGITFVSIKNIYFFKYKTKIHSTKGKSYKKVQKSFHFKF